MVLNVALTVPGTNLQSLINVATVLGSPPLAREQHFPGEYTASGAGITPACAGTTNRLL